MAEFNAQTDKGEVHSNHSPAQNTWCCKCYAQSKNKKYIYTKITNSLIKKNTWLNQCRLFRCKQVFVFSFMRSLMKVWGCQTCTGFCISAKAGSWSGPALWGSAVCSPAAQDSCRSPAWLKSAPEPPESSSSVCSAPDVRLDFPYPCYWQVDANKPLILRNIKLMLFTETQ